MFQATTNRIAASAASGMWAASGARNSRMAISVSACTMPASGLVAPLRMLVAVRAIAPVAAKPPNSGATMFARPWPTSSWFESCRVPAMPSATTADSSDSIAPSIAIVKAGPISMITCDIVSAGHTSGGRPVGMPPKALPIVAMPGHCSSWCRPVAMSIAIRGPGIRASGRKRGAYITSSRLSTARPAVGRWVCGRASTSCHSFSWKCSAAIFGSPRKSRHCPTKMMTPMPAVKPTITGAGMNLMTPPMRARPITSSIAPAISVATCSPAMPYWAVMPERIAMNAPVGPAICRRLPPNSDTRPPPMMAV